METGGVYWLRIIYDDFSEWEGKPTEFCKSPCKGVQFICVFSKREGEPRVGKTIFTGADDFAVQNLKNCFRVAKRAPYLKHATVCTFYYSGKVESKRYRKNYSIKKYCVRHGKWMTDEDYLKAHDIVRTW